MKTYHLTKKVNIQGFTLLEVLVAVAIFALVSLASFSIFDGVLTSDEESSKRMARINEIQRAWLVIERDLIQIARRSARIDGEAPQQQFIYGGLNLFGGGNDALAFVRHGWVNPGLAIPRSEMQAVLYRLNENTVERLHFNFVDTVVGQEPKIRSLLTHVSALSYQYFYQDKWQKTLKENALPLAIQVEIETEDLGLLSRKFLVTGDQS